MTQLTTVEARIHAITYGAQGILLFELRSPTQAALPSFEPGAHVDIHMPGGLQRSYSLLNDARERHRYVIGVKREAHSRGGSAWMHDQARTGALVTVSRPANQFALSPDASHSIFVAGGIGITPLWSMVQHLQASDRPWSLHYRGRSRASSVLIDELTQPVHAQRVHLSFSEDGAAGRLDLARIVSDAPDGSHFYCCGPAPMMAAFESACSHLDPARVHLEHFAAVQAPATDGGFVVKLARSGRVIPIAPGRTILETLGACGIEMPSSCQQGVCGQCEVAVVSGTPDHRDLVLSAAERASGRTMMICCSGSLSQELTLDI